MPEEQKRELEANNTDLLIEVPAEGNDEAKAYIRVDRVTLEPKDDKVITPPTNNGEALKKGEIIRIEDEDVLVL